ncbi:DAK2 domain-containing protein [Streptomyces abyssomicinicus]|uniref:DAK2 domain-containing protein n=1 Tax=Streptomyces abyssomicinicus TaxID=574929 RepID=UPI001250C4FA|nr:DAK2 domain-containing protein [Streptomyces abyssomicinicus]
MPKVPETFFDAPAVRAWCALALDALGRAREEIDAINVYPVPDGDTGTNLYLTLESAAAGVEQAFADGARPSLPEVMRAMAHGALVGARGNSGTICAQLLRGMAEGLDDKAPHADADALCAALRRAADSAWEAVARPVEGTVLSVASAAAVAATAASAASAASADGGGDCGAVVRAAYEGACEALARTPGQLESLGRAGVVDAGGRGLVAVLGALVEALTGERPSASPVTRPAGGTPVGPAVGANDAYGADACAAGHGHGGDDGDGDGPGYEVVYLLDGSDDEAVARLRERLDALGDSLVVVGGDGLWNVHVHVDDAGAAVEAGIEAGRPHRIRITHFAGDQGVRRGAPSLESAPEPVRRAVVAVLPGEGLAALCAEAGAATVLAPPGRPPTAGELLDAVRAAHAREVVLLPNDDELRRTAVTAAEQARAEGIRVALIPTRAAVQGIAALAVHQPERSFDEDVVSMTSAAGATRFAEVAVADRQAWTMAGICQPGDVLGMVEGDVALIGSDVTEVALDVLERMLSAGGELVTLVLDDTAPAALAATLESHVHDHHLAVDTVVHHGGAQGAPLLIGVE